MDPPYQPNRIPPIKKRITMNSLRLNFSTPRVTPMAQQLTLLSGHTMPNIGFGTWQIPKGIAAERTRDALEAGYRHIDFSPGFRNLSEVAEGYREWAAVRKMDRNEVFLSGKIWNTAHSREKCLEQVDMMLEEFNTPYIDLVCIHWPFGWVEDEPGEGGLFPRGPDGKMKYSNVDYMETYKALEEAVRMNKVRSLGICNFNFSQIDRVWIECQIKPSVISVEMNPYFPQPRLREHCKQRGIQVVAHMPIGNPGSTCYRKIGDPNLLFDEKLQAIARVHGKSVVQVVLRWIIDHECTAIIKSSDSRRIKNNINIFKFRLSPEEMSRIDQLNENFRLLNPILGNFDHEHFPWPHRKK